jgi:type VII secretion integral membrane protein EccD
VAAGYRLSLPGAAPLPAATTLAQNGIQDGAVLVLSRSLAGPPAPHCDDVAEAVSAALDAHSPSAQPRDQQRVTRLTGAVAAVGLTCIGVAVLIRNTLSTSASGYTAGAAASACCLALLGAATAHRVSRDRVAVLTLSAIATVFAAAAGFLTVPGSSGLANVLPAATAAALTSVLAIRATGGGGVALPALSCFAMVIAGAALAGVITGAPLPAIGAVSALVSLGLLGPAGRAAIALAGLSPRLPPPQHPDSPDLLAVRAIRADEWLASLLTAFSSSAAVGAIVTAVTAPGKGSAHLRCIAFAAATGALLLLRARSETNRAPIFAISGIATTGTTFAAAATGIPSHGTLLTGVTAILAAAAMYLGFAAPVISLSPVLRRGVELLEYLTLVAMVPLACWICGVYGAVRNLNLTWT